MEDIDKYIFETRGYFLQTDTQPQSCNCYRFNRLNTFTWFENWIITKSKYKNLAEVRFKNGRKGIYDNFEELFLKVGDIVAVEASTGHDIGLVSTMGEELFFQLKKYENSAVVPKIYRKAKVTDIEKWKSSISRETEILDKTKEIIEKLGLHMKLSDVEVQGDGSKATFFYTADDRVDFRELIKILASEFKVRIEMRQIGARQEAARVGGTGSCGMDLCCTKWKRTFESVTTNAARYQELSLNPGKLAGQCGKLKCCLNYEVDSYAEAKKEFPDTSVVLKTKQGNAYFQKSDVFKKILWYSFDPENAVNITALNFERVEEIIKMNKQGSIPDSLLYNNIELSHLISSKHNIKISENEIFDTSNNELDILNRNELKNKKKKKRKQNNQNIVQNSQNNTNNVNNQDNQNKQNNQNNQNNVNRQNNQNKQNNQNNRNNRNNRNNQQNQNNRNNQNNQQNPNNRNNLNNNDNNKNNDKQDTK